jgi:hypothetical protein
VSSIPLAMFMVGVVLFLIGTIARGSTWYFKSGIKQLLNCRATCEWCDKCKNEHYNRFLEMGRKWEQTEARYWQIRQVYEKARWSTLFSAFRVNIGAQ